MATSLSFGSVPAYYRDVYNLINSSSSIQTRKEAVKDLLAKSKLPAQTLCKVWELARLQEEEVTTEHVYTALALVGWAQQGKEVSADLLNSSVTGLPVVDLGELNLHRGFIAPRLGLRYPDLVKIDTIQVDIVPEKKGIFLKHVEYQVSSKRFDSTVCRRYNDFVALHELLLSRFPYRLIPKLPPKKMVGADSQFIENRRKSLRRWLTLIARHPVLSEDPILHYFLTQPVEDLQYKIREVFRRIPDEFTTSELAARAKELVPSDTHSEFATSREQIRVILNGVSRIKQIADVFALRSHGYAADMAELGNQLTALALEPGGASSWATGGNTTWADMKKGFSIISKEFTLLSSKASQIAIREEEEVCEHLNSLLDVLSGHRELCERVEKGVAHDHQKALSKMLELKKRQIQGVLRGSDAESVEALEHRMLAQENVIASMELRAAFSLHCVHLETQLVHAHLEILATVLNTLVAVQMRGHSDLAEVWKLIHPTVLKCLPDKNTLLS